jgi:hypothetical protein
LASRNVVRIYLTSEVRIEHGETLVGERDLPGRQGRVTLALLVAERDRPVTRDEIGEELWLDDPPLAWEKAVMAVMSKLRAALRRAGLDVDALVTSFGCYQLRLPPDTWVDVEAAADAVHRAETALMADDPSAAYPWAYVAYHVGRRPFLAGEDGPWVRRARLRLRRRLGGHFQRRPGPVCRQDSFELGQHRIVDGDARMPRLVLVVAGETPGGDGYHARGNGKDKEDRDGQSRSPEESKTQAVTGYEEHPPRHPRHSQPHTQNDE